MTKLINQSKQNQWWMKKLGLESNFNVNFIFLNQMLKCF